MISRLTRFTVVALLCAAPLALIGALYPAAAFDGARQVEDFWLGKGASAPVAKAWASEVNRESGGDPTMTGDGGSSIGAYQHHNDRARELLLNIQNNQAFAELMGNDPIASAHRDEILQAPTQAAAQDAIKRFFFRPAGARVPKPKPSAVKIVASQNQSPESSVAVAADVKRANLDPFSSERGSSGSSFLITNFEEK